MFQLTVSSDTKNGAASINALPSYQKIVCFPNELTNGFLLSSFVYRTPLFYGDWLC